MQNQFLGSVWRGARIDHASNEHDDFSAAVARLVNVLQVSTLNRRTSFCAARAEQPRIGTTSLIYPLQASATGGEGTVGYLPIGLIRAFCGSGLYIQCRVDDQAAGCQKR